MWWLIAKAFVSIGLIFFLFRNLDLSEIARQLVAVEHGFLLAAIAVVALLAVPMALRWSAILRAIGFPTSLKLTLPVVLIGQFFNQTLPSSIGGDAVRMWQLHSAGIPARAAISSVLIDRAAGLLAVCLLVTASLVVSFEVIPNRQMIGGVLLFLGVGYAGLAAAMLLDRVPSLLKRFKVVDSIAKLSASLRVTLLSPYSATFVNVYGVICQLGNVAVIYFLARGLGIRVDIFQCLVIIPIANLTTLLPISIGGWGVREGAYVMGFGLVDVGASDALALSVLFGLINLLVGLASGIIWLVRRDRIPNRGPLHDND
jgi:uncharacterized protein (TIRG00374 family)